MYAGLLVGHLKDEFGQRWGCEGVRGEGHLPIHAEIAEEIYGVCYSGRRLGGVALSNHFSTQG